MRDFMELYIEPYDPLCTYIKHAYSYKHGVRRYVYRLFWERQYQWIFNQILTDVLQTYKNILWFHWIHNSSAYAVKHSYKAVFHGTFTHSITYLIIEREVSYGACEQTFYTCTLVYMQKEVGSYRFLFRPSIATHSLETEQLSLNSIVILQELFGIVHSLHYGVDRI